MDHLWANKPATYFILLDELYNFVRGVYGPKMRSNWANGRRNEIIYFTLIFMGCNSIYSNMNHFQTNKPVTYFVLLNELYNFFRGFYGPKTRSTWANGCRNELMLTHFPLIFMRCDSIFPNMDNFLTNKPATYFILLDELYNFVRGVYGPKMLSNWANGRRNELIFMRCDSI